MSRRGLVLIVRAAWVSGFVFWAMRGKGMFLGMPFQLRRESALSVLKYGIRSTGVRYSMNAPLRPPEEI